MKKTISLLAIITFYNFHSYSAENKPYIWVKGSEIERVEKFTPRITQEDYNLAQETTPIMEVIKILDPVKEDIDQLKIRALESNKFIGFNFSNADLSKGNWDQGVFNLIYAVNANFQQCHGQFVRMIGANIENANLGKCIFSLGDFYGVIAKKTNFSNGTFTQCRFQNADLSEASFKGSSLSKSVFINCIWENTDFTDADLDKCTFIKCSGENADFTNVKGKYRVLIEKTVL